MALNLQQTDTASTVAPSTDLNRVMSDGGTAGAVETSIKVNAGSTEEAVAFVGTPGAGVSWDAGDVTARLDATTGDSTSEIREVYVRRYNSGGALQETLGSVTGLTTQLTAGVHENTISVSAATSPADTDRLAVVYLIGSTASHGNSSVGITPSQIVDTPLSAGSTTFSQTLAASGAGTPALSAVSTRLHTLTAGAVGTATLSALQVVGQTLTATATGAASLAALQVRGVTLAVSATGSAALSTIKSAVQALATTATGSAVLSPVTTFARTLTATASGTANLTKKAYSTLTATVTATAALDAGLLLLQTLQGSAAGSAAISAALKFGQTFSGVASATAALATKLTEGASDLYHGARDLWERNVINRVRR